MLVCSVSLAVPYAKSVAATPIDRRNSAAIHWPCNTSLVAMSDAKTAVNEVQQSLLLPVHTTFGHK